MKMFLMILTAALLMGAPHAQATAPNVIQVQKALVFASASIANGQTASAAISMSGLSLVGIQLPAAFTGTTITFTGSFDGVTYQVVKATTSGTSLSYTVAQGTYVAIDPLPFYGLAFIKLVSGSAEGGARSFSVALKGL